MDDYMTKREKVRMAHIVNLESYNSAFNTFRTASANSLTFTLLHIGADIKMHSTAQQVKRSRAHVPSISDARSVSNSTKSSRAEKAARPSQKMRNYTSALSCITMLSNRIARMSRRTGVDGSDFLNWPEAQMRGVDGGAPWRS